MSPRRGLQAQWADRLKPFRSGTGDQGGGQDHCSQIRFAWLLTQHTKRTWLVRETCQVRIVRAQNSPATSEWPMLTPSVKYSILPPSVSVSLPLDGLESSSTATAREASFADKAAVHITVSSPSLLIITLLCPRFVGEAMSCMLCSRKTLEKGTNPPAPVCSLLPIVT